MGTIVSASTVNAEKGGPFAEIWAAIFGIQTDIEDIEKRLDALENPPPPMPPIVSDVIIPTGTSVPGCEETDECYLPFEAAVKVGEELTWTNTDSAAHTVTSGTPGDGPSGEFDSSLLFSTGTFSHTFNSTGKFSYFCLVHPWMTGKVIVI